MTRALDYELPTLEIGTRGGPTWNVEKVPTAPVVP